MEVARVRNLAREEGMSVPQHAQSSGTSLRCMDPAVAVSTIHCMQRGHGIGRFQCEPTIYYRADFCTESSKVYMKICAQT